MTISAGYRFVPIDDGKPQDSFVGFEDIHHTLPIEDGHSGTLEVTWQSFQPVCVGVDIGNNETQPFSLNLKNGTPYALPGASLRGMIRSVFEIVTNSHLWKINAHHRFAMRDLSDPYKRLVLGKKIKAGWLTKNNGQWILRPTIHKEDQTHNGNFKEVNILHPELLNKKNDSIKDKFDHCVENNQTFGDNNDTIKKQLNTFRNGQRNALMWRYLNISDKYNLFTGLSGHEFKRISFRNGSYRNYPNITISRNNIEYSRNVLFMVGKEEKKEPGFKKLVQIGAEGTEGFLVFTGPNEDRKITEAVFTGPATGQDIELSEDQVRPFFEVYSIPAKGGGWKLSKESALAFWMKQRGYKAPDGFTVELDEIDKNEILASDDWPGIPVFYHDVNFSDKKVGGNFYLGLSRLPKIPFKNTVGQIAQRSYPNGDAQKYTLPDLSKDIDPARAVFGDVEGEDSGKDDKRLALKGRVFFEFAKAENPPPHLDEQRLVFESPKASFFPNYLRCKDNDQRPIDYSDHVGNDGPRKEVARLSGRKRYPVRETITPASESDANNTGTVQFLPNGTNFKGRIRYHNLSLTELGALLWSLNFGEKPSSSPKYRHAIGRGKNMGFGQIATTEWSLTPTTFSESQTDNDNLICEAINEFKKKMGSHLQSDQVKLLRSMANPERANDRPFETPQLDDFVKEKTNRKNRIACYPKVD